MAYERVVRALQRAGWVVARQRGSHLRLQNHTPRETLKLIVPAHRPTKRPAMSSRRFGRDASRHGALREILRCDEEDLLAMRRTPRRARRRRAPATTAPADIRVTRGSGNVFADLGLPNPEEHLAKAQLVLIVDYVIRDRGLTQQEAAKLMGIDQPQVSHLLRGRFAGFSTHRLIEFLTALGRDVDIIVRAAPKARKRGRLQVARA